MQAKAKDPPTDALPAFLKAYTSHERVGTLTKEPQTGKLMDEWNQALDGAERKPTVADVAPAVAAFMAVKDDDELVGLG